MPNSRRLVLCQLFKCIVLLDLSRWPIVSVVRRERALVVPNAEPKETSEEDQPD